MLPTSFIFSNSTKQLEKASNRSFASSLARYIIQTMMTMKIDDIRDTDHVSEGGISFCDNSDDNIFFNTLFNNFNNKIEDFDSGYVNINSNSCRNLYNRLAKNDFRYIIKGTPVQLAGPTDDKSSSINVGITWNESGERIRYNFYAIIVEK